MKKSALALAVLGAFAGAASAQSSVTLFGVVDMNVTYVDNSDSMWLLGQDGMASSRLGFRGVEDLGGGLKASFWLEGALGPDTGTGSSSTGNGNTTGPGAYMFRRRSTLSLSNQWGELRLGRDYTPTFWNWTVFDPFGTNGVGAATNLGLSAALRNFGSAGDAFGTLVRANNTVGYILPAGQYGPGLYGQFMVAAGEKADLNKYFGGRLGYASGPWDVAFAYGYTYIDANEDNTFSNWNIAGSWNFGVVKVSAFYGQIETDLQVSANDVRQKNFYIGAAAPFGQWNFKGSWGWVEQGKALDNDAWQLALGADYNLSKRTAIYGTYSYINNSNNAGFAVWGGPTLNAGDNSQGFQVGVRHSF
jgi:predicted porin